jgi:hypothetical protein
VPGRRQHDDRVHRTGQRGREAQHRFTGKRRGDPVVWRAVAAPRGEPAAGHGTGEKGAEGHRGARVEKPGAPAMAKARNTTLPVMFAVNTCPSAR